jgi:23S rRNA (cytidine1920-2'-O)/16S rRNA (cytidine1409-2'-O)-methyltransferase
VKERKRAKESLVEHLVRTGLSADAEVAKKEILAGLIRVNQGIADKVGLSVREGDVVEKVGARDFVSRAAHKLQAACELFPIPVRNAVCADVGACTGGFTQVLLQHGARKVFAIDVGYGNLDWKIRSDERVVVMERTNARSVEGFTEPVSVVSIDVSFVSLQKILPVVVRWLSRDGHVVALIKPQFEASREEVEAGGGIIRDPEIHDRIVNQICEFLPTVGLTKNGVAPSPILGAEGNKEFLLWATFTEPPVPE